MMSGNNTTDNSYDHLTAICSEVTLQSAKKGFFKGFADYVIETISSDWLKEFSNLQTDIERIRKCFYDEKMNDLVVNGAFRSITQLYRIKCAKIARQKRLECVQSRDKGDLEMAIQLASQAVIRSPLTGVDPEIDGGLTLALGLWERSSILIMLKKYPLALTDLQLSLIEKLAESFRSECYYRMAICYVEMKENKKASVALKLALRLAQNKNNEWKLKIAEKLKLVEEDSLKNTRFENANDKEMPKLSLDILDKKCCDELPCASNKLALVKSNINDAGRFVIAKESIKAGDTLIVEDPFVAVLIPNKFASNCLHCFIRLSAAVPCPECSGVAFCSTDCRDQAIATYHRYECKYLDLLLGSGMSVLCHAALRIITRSKSQHFMNYKNNVSSSPSDPYSRFLDLVSHNDKRIPTDFLRRTLMALFLLRVLQCSGYFGASFDTDKLSEEEEWIGALLLRHLLVLQFNVHEIYDTVMKSRYDFKSTNLNYKAVGVYLSAAMFNHECYPSVTRYFVGDKIILRAVRPLNPGDSVSENYGPIYSKKSLSERQRTLKSRYLFTCSCRACLEDWPQYETMDENVFLIRCSSKECNGFIKGSIKLIDDKNKAKCPICDHVIKLKDSLMLIRSFVDDHTKALSSMNDGNLDVAEKLLYSYLNSIEKVVRPPNKDVSLCQEALRSCWAVKQGSVFYTDE